MPEGLMGRATEEYGEMAQRREGMEGLVGQAQPTTGLEEMGVTQPPTSQLIQQYLSEAKQQRLNKTGMLAKLGTVMIATSIGLQNPALVEQYIDKMTIDDRTGAFIRAMEDNKMKTPQDMLLWSHGLRLPMETAGKIVEIWKDMQAEGGEGFTLGKEQIRFGPGGKEIARGMGKEGFKPATAEELKDITAREEAKYTGRPDEEAKALTDNQILDEHRQWTNVLKSVQMGGLDNPLIQSMVARNLKLAKLIATKDLTQIKRNTLRRLKWLGNQMKKRGLTLSDAEQKDFYNELRNAGVSTKEARAIVGVR